MQVRSAQLVLCAALLVFAFVLSGCDRAPPSLDDYRDVFARRDFERQKSVTAGSLGAILVPPQNVGAASVRWCGDDRLLSRSSALLVWDVQTRTVLHKLEVKSPGAIACSRDGRLVATGNYDRSSTIALRVWDLAKPQSFRDIAGPFPMVENRNDSILRFVAFTPDGTSLFAHFVNVMRTAHKVVIYDVGSLKVIRQFSFLGKLEGRPVLNRQGDRYAFGQRSQRIVVIDTESGTQLGGIEVGEVLPQALAFGRKDDTIWVAGRRTQDTVNGKTRDGHTPYVLQEFSVADRQLVNSIDSGHIDRLTGVLFREQSDLLISASADKTIEVRQGRSGRLVAVYGDKKNAIASVALDPSGQVLASAARSVVELWPLNLPPISRR
jgi:WD40 repeat protein